MTRCLNVLFRVFLSVALVLAFIPFAPTNAFADEVSDNANETELVPSEQGDNANSWRYFEGELVSGQQAATFSTLRSTPITSWEPSCGTSSFYYQGETTAVSGVKAVVIDVAEHQGVIDWNKVKADGVTHAIIRCGYGQDQTNQDDKYWLKNVKGALNAGLQIGVYIYSYAYTEKMALGEANHVLRCLEEAGLTPSMVDLPIYYDLEEESGMGKPCVVDGNKVAHYMSASTLGAMAKKFCDTLSAKGYKVGIYANTNWWNSYLTDSVFENQSWSKWVAQYGKSCSYSGTKDLWQFTSNGVVNGINARVDVNFSFAETGSWKKTDGKWYWINSEGNAITGWKTISGTRYYFNSSGVMQTGWQEISGKWYYFNSSGAMKTGWVKPKTKWYYLDFSGVMQTGWEKVGDSWYYLNSSGVMQTGWEKVSGKWYYMNSSGVMQTGWEKVSGKWYYMNSSGVMQTGWEKIDSKWYYMNSSGVMQASKWIGKYYVLASGKMATNQWIGGYYVGPTGKRVG